jgi:aminomethyltransferase
MKETPLKKAHEARGARLVEFGGWNMPVQYRGILDEVRCVRARAGLFDLSHMGRVRVRGAGAEDFLQRVTTNDVSKIAPGAIRYSLLLDERGLTQDDILVYRDPGGDSFFLVINAGNTDRDLAILREHAGRFGAEVVDQTQELAMVAIQGPESEAITAALTDIPLAQLGYYKWARGKVCGADCEVSRTGYTGEDGFEFYFAGARAGSLWEQFLEAGAARGLLPIGLAARDTLRLEAGMPLYGHELDETTNPLEAGLDWAVKFTKDFIGRGALEEVRRTGLTRRLAGLTTPSKRVPRQGYPLIKGDEQVGAVCSGTASPTLGTNIATGYLPTGLAEPGTEVAFQVKDSREPATVVPLPFYKRKRS